MSYQPSPIDTTDVTLPPFLQDLLERFAKNTHDTWAAQRIAEGWTFGAERDDQLKTSPCLVPYEELPESEKEYDRHTSAETLKAVLKLGYTIQPGSPVTDEAAKDS